MENKGARSYLNVEPLAIGKFFRIKESIENNLLINVSVQDEINKRITKLIDLLKQLFDAMKNNLM